MGGVPEIGPVDFTPLPPSTNVDLDVGRGSRTLSVSAGHSYGYWGMPAPAGLAGQKFDWMFFVSGQQFRLKVTAKIYSYENDTGRKHYINSFEHIICSEMYVEATTTLAFDRVTGKAVGIVESPSLEGVYREFFYHSGLVKTELSRTSLPSTAATYRWGNPRFGKTMAEVSGSSFRLFKGNWMSFIKVSGP